MELTKQEAELCRFVRGMNRLLSLRYRKDRDTDDPARRRKMLTELSRLAHIKIKVLLAVEKGSNESPFGLAAEAARSYKPVIEE